MRMQDAMCRVPCSLDLIGQGSPRLSHAEQRSLAPGVLKVVRDLEAVGGAPLVERYEFAGRHPHPQYVFARKSKGGSLFRVARKKLAGSFDVPAIFHDGSAGCPQGTPGARGANCSRSKRLRTKHAFEMRGRSVGTNWRSLCYRRIAGFLPSK
jgi:hypothetical protein